MIAMETDLKTWVKLETFRLSVIAACSFTDVHKRAYYCHKWEIKSFHLQEVQFEELLKKKKKTAVTKT
jgi:hypothetical protein